jgi:uncharacterized membrane protein
MKAEMEILGLHGKMDELRQAQWELLMELQRKQLDVLMALEKQICGDTKP